MRERHIVKVAVSQEFFLEFLYEGYEQTKPFRVIKGLPKDAKFIYSYYDFKSAIEYYIFEHDSFLPVFLGGEIPTLDIHIETAETKAEEIHRKVMPA